METRVRLLSPEHRGKQHLSIQANHRAESKGEKRPLKKGRSCAWMQDNESLKRIRGAAVIQSCVKKSLKGKVSVKLELCTNAPFDSKPVTIVGSLRKTRDGAKGSFYFKKA